MTRLSRRCARCGTLLPDSARFCPHCGARVAEPGQRSPVAAVLWAVSLGIAALVLGGVGACFLIGGLSMLGGGGGISPLALLMLLIAAAALAAMVKVLR